jgi:hypothetical protein
MERIGRLVSSVNEEHALEFERSISREAGRTFANSGQRDQVYLSETAQQLLKTGPGIPIFVSSDCTNSMMTNSLKMAILGA